MEAFAYVLNYKPTHAHSAYIKGEDTCSKQLKSMSKWVINAPKDAGQLRMLATLLLFLSDAWASQTS